MHKDLLREAPDEARLQEYKRNVRIMMNIYNAVYATPLHPHFFWSFFNTHKRFFNIKDWDQ